MMGLAYLPGGKQLAMVDTTGVMELRTGSDDWQVKGFSSLFSLAVAPSGQLLAAGDSMGNIHLTKVSSHELVATLPAPLTGHEDNVYAVAFTPTGETLISGGADGTVRVWDVPTCRLAETFRWHTSWVTCVGVSPDGMTAAAGSADGTVVIWDLDR